MDVLIEKIKFQNLKIYIKRDFIKYAILCMLLILPDDIFVMLSLYSNHTMDEVPYKWLNYEFGVMQLLIVVVALLMVLIKRKNNILLVLLALLSREVIFALFSEKNIFATNSYEMYLCLLVGGGLVLFLIQACKKIEEIEKLFMCIVYLNIASIFLNLFMNLNGIEGRYNATNLDVGTTGLICAVGLIYTFYRELDNNKKTISILLQMIALFLSGSRISLLLLILFIVVIVFNNVFKALNRNVRVNRNFPYIFGAIIVGVLVGAGYVLSSNEIMGKISEMMESIRIISTLSLESILEDESFTGRFKSIVAGINIVKDNPMGLSYYFNNIQYESHVRGFSTFPHSGVLCFYIFFGPLTILGIGFLIKILSQIRKKDIKWFYILAYVLVFNTISGGPITNFKQIFIYGTIIYVCYAISRKSFKREKEEFYLNIDVE